MMLDIAKAVGIFLALDFIYLSLMKQNFISLVRNIQGNELSLKPLPTLMVYIYILCVWYYFIYEPRIHMTKRESVINSFVLGFLTYGIYDFTNLAIFDKWDIKTVVIDNIWGGILFSIPTLFIL